MRGPLGALFGRLRALWGHPGALLGRLGGLGLSWGPREAVLGSLGGLLWPSGGFPSSVLGPSGVRLGPSWGSLGPSWGPFGPSGGSLGCLRGGVGAVLQAHPAVLDALPTRNASLAKIYIFRKGMGRLLPRGGPFGGLRGRLRAGWSRPGGVCGASGAVLEPSGAVLDRPLRDRGRSECSAAGPKRPRTLPERPGGGRSAATD